MALSLHLQVYTFWLPAEKVQVQQRMAKALGRFYRSLSVFLQDFSGDFLSFEIHSTKWDKGPFDKCV